MVVILGFHNSNASGPEKPIQKLSYLNKIRGVFSTSSTHRQNSIRLSVLKFLDVTDNIVRLRRLDLYDENPILDIKSYIKYKPEGR
ncbi:MAG: TrmO family methyltransferase domain-containing protein [Caldisericum sp.]|uniref:TrmO family methyltransferase n=2 Tax=Pseudomonadati TaxID=3379134 RepID=A0AAU8H4M3_9BACT